MPSKIAIIECAEDFLVCWEKGLTFEAKCPVHSWTSELTGNPDVSKPIVALKTQSFFDNIATVMGKKIEWEKNQKDSLFVFDEEYPTEKKDKPTYFKLCVCARILVFNEFGKSYLSIAAKLESGVVAISVLFENTPEMEALFNKAIFKKEAQS